MKKVLLIIGIVAIVACVLFLLFALLNMYGYQNLYDGTPEHYNWLHKRMVISFIIGIILAVIGTISLIIRQKM